jgi:hypothetical protein
MAKKKSRRVPSPTKYTAYRMPISQSSYGMSEEEKKELVKIGVAASFAIAAIVAIVLYVLTRMPFY